MYVELRRFVLTSGSEAKEESIRLCFTGVRKVGQASAKEGGLSLLQRLSFVQYRKVRSRLAARFIASWLDKHRNKVL